MRSAAAVQTRRMPLSSSPARARLEGEQVRTSLARVMQGRPLVGARGQRHDIGRGTDGREPHRGARPRTTPAPMSITRTVGRLLRTASTINLNRVAGPGGAFRVTRYRDGSTSPVVSGLEIGARTLCVVGLERDGGDVGADPASKTHVDRVREWSPGGPRRLDLLAGRRYC